MQTKISVRSGAVSDARQAADLCRSRYREAASWRRAVKRALRPTRITFTQWILLQTMTELFFETGDPPSELAIATVSGIDRMTVSQVVTKLIRRGFVSVGPDAVWPGLRLAPSRSGEQAAREGAIVVEAESLRWLGEQNPRAA